MIYIFIWTLDGCLIIRKNLTIMWRDQNNSLVISLIWVENTQLVKKKVTYLAQNFETAQSSVMECMSVSKFDQADKYT